MELRCVCKSQNRYKSTYGNMGEFSNTTMHTRIIGGYQTSFFVSRTCTQNLRKAPDSRRHFAKRRSADVKSLRVQIYGRVWACFGVAIRKSRWVRTVEDGWGAGLFTWVGDFPRTGLGWGCPPKRSRARPPPPGWPCSIRYH